MQSKKLWISIPDRKKTNWRTWNFKKGYWRKKMWKFQGSMKKEVEFPGQGCSRKLMWHVEFPSGSLGFDLGISKAGVSHKILLSFQGWKLVFSGISMGKVTNLKFPGGSVGFRKVQPPVCFFSGIAHAHFPVLGFKNSAENKYPKNVHHKDSREFRWGK